MDLKFFNLNTQRELRYDPDAETFTTPQYKSWFVRVVSDNTITPHIRAGDALVPMRWNDNLSGFLLPQSLPDDWNIFADAGLLTLFAGPNRPLTPSLYINPVNLTETEFAAILDRLGQLAFAEKHGFLCPVVASGLDAEKLSQDEQPSRASSQAELYIHLAQCLERSWSEIEKTPAKEIKQVSRVVDTSNPANLRSMPAIYQSCRRPDMRRQQILDREENYDTLENRFLAYVIKEVMLRDAQPLADHFRSKAEWIRTATTRPAPSYGRSYIELWQARQQAVQAEANRLNSIANTIEQHAERAAQFLQTPLLRNIRSNRLPDMLSAGKIAQSISYGPIYRAYQAYSGGQTNKEGRVTSGITRALEERAIRPIPELFEMWAFLQVYARLVTAFGFLPKGTNPLDEVQFIDGEPALEKGSVYTLVFEPKNMQGTALTCEIELAYNPKVSVRKCDYGKTCFTNSCNRLGLFCFREINHTKNWADGLTPDMLMTINSPRGRKRIALDVKYRNYRDQRNPKYEIQQNYGITTTFEWDLFGTAKMKYLDALGTDASFILHSDPNQAYTTFGSEPFTLLPQRERILNEPFYPGHRIGAIHISPTKLDGLDKLLRCILMYHAKMEDICWSCQNQLTTENGGLSQQEGMKGNYYQCPDCGRFWVASHCRNNSRHRLIKLGRDSFHKTEEGKDWQCICPQCGNQLDDKME